MLNYATGCEQVSATVTNSWAPESLYPMTLASGFGQGLRRDHASTQLKLYHDGKNRAPVSAYASSGHSMLPLDTRLRRTKPTTSGEVRSSSEGVALYGLIKLENQYDRYCLANPAVGHLRYPDIQCRDLTLGPAPSATNCVNRSLGEG